MSGSGHEQFTDRESRLEEALGTVRRLFEEQASSAPGEPAAAVAAATDGTDDLLMNLYVAGLHLHGSLDLHDVLVNLREILINLVGVERFVLYVADSTARNLRAVADETGLVRGPATAGPEGGIVSVVVRTGIPYFAADDDAETTPGGPCVACVPLKMAGAVLGVVKIERLVAHKSGFEQRDHEILNLVGEQSGPALLAAALYRRYLGTQNGTSPGPAGVLFGLLDVAPGTESSQETAP
ncbi:MAG: GAF domain-containing protein [Acidobacteriota bacterium]